MLCRWTATPHHVPRRFLPARTSHYLLLWHACLTNYTPRLPPHLVLWTACDIRWTEGRPPNLCSWRRSHRYHRHHLPAPRLPTSLHATVRFSALAHCAAAGVLRLCPLFPTRAPPPHPLRCHATYTCRGHTAAAQQAVCNDTSQHAALLNATNTYRTRTTRVREGFPPPQQAVTYKLVQDHLPPYDPMPAFSYSATTARLFSPHRALAAPHPRTTLRCRTHLPLHTCPHLRLTRPPCPRCYPPRYPHPHPHPLPPPPHSPPRTRAHLPTPPPPCRTTAPPFLLNMCAISPVALETNGSCLQHCLVSLVWFITSAVLTSQ